MKRFGLFLLGTLLLATSLLAQDAKSIEVNWSQDYKNSELKFDFISGLDSSVFTSFGSTSRLLLNDSKYYYACYDRFSMKQIWQVEETIETYRDAKMTFHSMESIGQTTYVFYQAYSKENDVRYLLMRTIDAEGKLFDVIELQRFNAKRAYMGGFKVSWNNNATSFAVVSFHEEDLNEEFQIEVNRFDSKGNKLDSASVKLDDASRNVRIMDLDYSINGDVYILAVRRPENNENDKRKIGAKNKEFFILHLNPNDQVFKEVDLGLNDKYVVGGIGIETDQIPGKVAISGMYSDIRYSSISGMFFITLDQSSIEPVTKEFINLREFLYLNDGDTNRTALARLNVAVNKSYVFRGIVPREGGGSLVMIEEYDMMVSTRSNGSTITTYYHYFYDNIWVMMVDDLGKIERVSVIPKRQHTINDGGIYSGFLLLRDHKNFQFIFNDKRGNDQKWAQNLMPKPMVAPRSANLVQVTLVPGGKLIYNTLIESSKEKAVLIPSRGRSYLGLPGEAVIPGIKRGKWVFMSLSPERN